MYKIKAIWYNDLEQKVFCKCTHHLYQLYIYNNFIVVEENGKDILLKILKQLTMK